MRTEKRVLVGVFVMLVFLLAGVVGTVSAAAQDQTEQLRMEVQLLQRINELNLTNEQIDKLLPILKNVQSILQKSEADLDALLAKEKELLLQRKTQEVEALQVEKKIIREKAALQVKTALVDLQKILTPDQMKKIQSHLPMGIMQGTKVKQITGKKDEAYLHGTATGMIKMETANGVVMIQKKDGQQGKDVKVEHFVTMKLSTEAAKGMLQNQEKRLAELEAQLAKAKDKEKDVLKQQVEQLKVCIAELKKEIAQSTDGTVLIQPNMMGQNYMMMSDMKPGQGAMQGMVTKEMRSEVMISKGQRGQIWIQAKQGFAFGKRTEVLSTLIKVLEEMRKAK